MGLGKGLRACENLQEGVGTSESRRGQARGIRASKGACKRASKRACERVRKRERAHRQARGCRQARGHTGKCEGADKKDDLQEASVWAREGACGPERGQASGTAGK